MDHWTILLDLYIIYKIVAHVIVGEKNAYCKQSKIGS